VNDESKLLFNDNSLKGNRGAKDLGSTQSKAIMLHFEEPAGTSNKGHYILINTLIGYGSVVQCHICKKMFKSDNNHRDLKRHMNKHSKEIPSGEQGFKFKQGLLQSKKTQYEKMFGMPCQSPMFLAFDFECLLEKEDVTIKKEHYTQKHVPIGVVCKVWTAQADKKFKDFKYVGLDVGKKLIDYLENIHDDMIQWKTKQFYKAHAKKLEQIEKTMCDCDSKEHQHRGFCNKYANQVQSKQDDPCCCSSTGMKKRHKRKCKYSSSLRAVVAEWTITPILGFNSGKYDMCFVVNAMDDSRLTIQKSEVVICVFSLGSSSFLMLVISLLLLLI
jgi:hypothetical protein